MVIVIWSVFKRTYQIHIKIHHNLVGFRTLRSVDVSDILNMPIKELLQECRWMPLV